ncbi:MAG: extracellular solute-binding protein [Anaerolineales bacterium]|nr:extracellular solute-binding protein [Anaerolineales bacterium]
MALRKPRIVTVVIVIILFLVGCRQEQGMPTPAGSLFPAVTATPTSAEAYPVVPVTEAPASPAPSATVPEAYPPPEGADATTAPPEATLESTPDMSVPLELPRSETPTVGVTTTPTTTATYSPPKPLGTPPAPGSTVSIWLAWDEIETQALMAVINSFQDLYPGIHFDLLYIPLDELRARYESAVYYGEGPSLLFGPAEWGPALYDAGYVAELTPYSSQEFLDTMIAPGLEACRYQGALVSLPQSLHGVVMYRNATIISSAPETFDELAAAAQQASRGGRLGAYLEQGAYFSVAHLDGLGGSLMDANGDPDFNNEFGLAWLELMADFRQPGVAPTFNTNRDVELFMNGRIGIIIEDTNSRNKLAQAIGAENLFIDSWPAYGSGHLSGYVLVDSLYLNANVSGENQHAALQFIGYLLDGQVQTLLSEVGHIPSVETASPRNVHNLQAMTALAGGIPYPTQVDKRYLFAYWDALENVLRDVFEREIAPQDALQAAYEAVVERLAEFRSGEP